MKKLIENLANLIKVKTFITFAVIGLFVALALSGNIPANDVTSLTLMVVSFYFGTQAEKKGGNGGT